MTPTESPRPDLRRPPKATSAVPPDGSRPPSSSASRVAHRNAPGGDPTILHRTHLPKALRPGTTPSTEPGRRSRRRTIDASPVTSQPSRPSAADPAYPTRMRTPECLGQPGWRPAHRAPHRLPPPPPHRTGRGGVPPCPDGRGAQANPRAEGPVCACFGAAVTSWGAAVTDHRGAPPHRAPITRAGGLRPQRRRSAARCGTAAAPAAARRCRFGPGPPGTQRPRRGRPPRHAPGAAPRPAAAPLPRRG